MGGRVFGVSVATSEDLFGHNRGLFRGHGQTPASAGAFRCPASRSVTVGQDRAMDREPSTDALPDPEAVSSRAEGRPPEEASSDDPERQAQVILEESEERILNGAAKSEGDDDEEEEEEEASGSTTTDGNQSQAPVGVSCGGSLTREDGSEGHCSLPAKHSGLHLEACPSPPTPAA